LSPCLIRAQIVLAMRLASAIATTFTTFTTFTGLRARIRSSHAGDWLDASARRPRRALIWAIAPKGCFQHDPPRESSLRRGSACLGDPPGLSFPPLEWAPGVRSSHAA
jgi:hypothetical protein